MPVKKCYSSSCCSAHIISYTDKLVHELFLVSKHLLIIVQCRISQIELDDNLFLGTTPSMFDPRAINRWPSSHFQLLHFREAFYHLLIISSRKPLTALVYTTGITSGSEESRTFS